MRFLLMFLLSLTVASCGGSYLDDPIEEWPDHFLEGRCSNPHGYAMMTSEEFAEIKKRGIGKSCLTAETYKKALKAQQEALALKKRNEALLSEMSSKLPSSWSTSARKKFRSMDWDDQCKYVMNLEYSGDFKSAGVLKQNLGSSGIIRRDVDIIVDPEARFGTGMSYYGVQCAGGRIVNTSYYPGLGHTWQMKLGGSYLYLEGNGRDSSMRVRSWN